ncbi:MAG: PhoU domain-containing protein [Thermoprotei archaeon]
MDRTNSDSASIEFTDKFTRRVQFTGGSTFVVSLPAEWVKAVGLKPKQEVRIIPQSDLSLLVLVGDREGGLSGGLVDAAKCVDEEEALREFIANYIAGYDSIKIKCEIGDFRHRLKSQIREKLIGVEVVEETSEYILIQCLHGDTDLPLNKALRRMALLVKSMLQDSLNALLTLDFQLAQEVISRDDEVDRFAYYILRQLNRSLLNPALIQSIGMKSLREFIPFTVLVRSVERIADHATQIASSTIDLRGVEFDGAIVEKLKSLASSSQQLFDSAMNSVYTLDTKSANSVIRRVRETLDLEANVIQLLFASTLDAKSVSLLRLGLESLRRVAEYSADICETVVDVSVSSQLKFYPEVD